MIDRFDLAFFEQRWNQITDIKLHRYTGHLLESPQVKCQYRTQTFGQEWDPVDNDVIIGKDCGQIAMQNVNIGVYHHEIDHYYRILSIVSYITVWDFLG